MRFEDLSTAVADLADGAMPAVVGIRSHRARSSGFAWRPDLVVTADEALADEGEITLTLPDGSSRAATIAGRDPSTDVALLRVEGGGLAPVALALRESRAGALALAVGYGGVALGAVALAGPAWRSMRGGQIDARIELDIRLRRETEGAIVLDAGGAAIGMAVAGPHRRVLVIPTATIERVAGRLATAGRIGRGWLGLALQPVQADGDGARGAMVMSVSPAGPGETAGLCQGDLIVSWDGQTLPGLAALLRTLGPDSIGRRLALGVRRGAATLECTLTIDERPAG